MLWGMIIGGVPEYRSAPDVRGCGRGYHYAVHRLGYGGDDRHTSSHLLRREWPPSVCDDLPGYANQYSGSRLPCRSAVAATHSHRRVWRRSTFCKTRSADDWRSDGLFVRSSDQHQHAEGIQRRSADQGFLSRRNAPVPGSSTRGAKSVCQQVRRTRAPWDEAGLTRPSATRPARLAAARGAAQRPQQSARAVVQVCCLELRPNVRD
jgi:hypothetical protein